MIVSYHLIEQVESFYNIKTLDNVDGLRAGVFSYLKKMAYSLFLFAYSNWQLA